MYFISFCVNENDFFHHFKSPKPGFLLAPRPRYGPGDSGWGTSLAVAQSRIKCFQTTWTWSRPCAGKQGICRGPKLYSARCEQPELTGTKTGWRGVWGRRRNFVNPSPLNMHSTFLLPCHLFMIFDFRDFWGESWLSIAFIYLVTPADLGVPS